ncbi:hypothetical protein COX69_04330 [Candidatus Falkowbacteria bacterium CG_4_10_14_0_2_um_filter_48_10]|uniref:Sporulation stage II protein D amidase enhancer LytB N-terminal domain-containing protein n=1 Tax=Candidatus Falkowbacteria bacterium CG23_combo_of_CG06-09_8_20_14_all_49_15 TaxID=1974572 RepID=A0A2G9ZM64_9BACT|nr:MAG: hypothetical protein COX22_00205 [Candidatus Falkowbacteria bacterium CG23_combo_of_CG06-09_8_20_14_all_49_15]PJA07559.1 MAG: hypothetical protein COX69_04330 [Candidatus Falkowbacteria bacterium CG_4_10_14_0_2_um_filter_48_10]
MKKYFFIGIFFCLFFAAGTARAKENFNPNNIISNEEMMDNRSMTLAEIQTFLTGQKSFLAKYVCANYKNEMKTAAEIIYDAAVNNFDCSETAINLDASLAEKQKFCRPVKINPKLLIVLLQKEQSLIESASPAQKALDWAVGYGCPDGQACNERWRGFGKQVNSAALQFFDYLTNPQRYSYRAGQSYTVTNTNRPPAQITPENHATAALYNYTPHVYNGNYNFFKLWQKYFTFSYLDGSLLQVKGQPGVWLISNGYKRPFSSKTALTSRFDLNKIIVVSQTDIDRYPIGAAIKFPQYSLLRSPRGTIYLIIDDERRGFASQEAFRKMGYNPEEVISATWDEINAYREIAPITATSSYPIGALLQDKSTGGIYYVFEGRKAPLWDASLLKTKFKNFSIYPVDSKKLLEYENMSPAIFSDGELLKTPNSPGIYLIAGGQKHVFTSGEIFEKLGYKWVNVITINEKILSLYPDGAPIQDLAISAEEAEEEEIITETPAPNPAPTSPAASSSEEIMEKIDRLIDRPNPNID